MHSILHVKANWSASENNETFKERLVQSRFRGLLVHDDGTKLLMVSNKNHLLASQDQRDHAFRFRRLCRFIDENSSKFKFGKSRVPSADASAANNVSVGQDLAFSSTRQLLEFLFILT